MILEGLVQRELRPAYWTRAQFSTSQALHLPNVVTASDRSLDRTQGGSRCTVASWRRLFCINAIAIQFSMYEIRIFYPVLCERSARHGI
jgi:hypothetical protein